MFIDTNGSLFDGQFDALINTVNCQGVMGTGIALKFKQKHPTMFKQYKLDCDRHKLTIGKGTRFDCDDGLIIFNLPTKFNWYDESTLHYVEQGLIWLKKELELEECMKVAIPQLGCGNGGLKWEVVKPLIKTHLEELQHDIYLFN